MIHRAMIAASQVVVATKIAMAMMMLGAILVLAMAGVVAASGTGKGGTNWVVEWLEGFLIKVDQVTRPLFEFKKTKTY